MKNLVSKLINKFSNSKQLDMIKCYEQGYKDFKTAKTCPESYSKKQRAQWLRGKLQANLDSDSQQKGLLESTKAKHSPF